MATGLFIEICKKQGRHRLQHGLNHRDVQPSRILDQPIPIQPQLFHAHGIGFIAANRAQVVAFAFHAHFHHDGAMRGVRAVRGGVLEGVGTVAPGALQVSRIFGAHCATSRPMKTPVADLGKTGSGLNTVRLW